MMRAIAGACLYARLKHWRRAKKKIVRDQGDLTTQRILRENHLYLFVSLI